MHKIVVILEKMCCFYAVNHAGPFQGRKRGNYKNRIS